MDENLNSEKLQNIAKEKLWETESFILKKLSEEVRRFGDPHSTELN